ncbi:HAD-IIIC family phosphatase [Aquimarina mytili]|uniref:HAD family hydrolase n=1 Tax=Aquimarina mytili TaxID=874423 RepID=A0A936ZWF0_9FLAO|nr:HAD-IIIC family phosphatase [Aquimarina mytili]MBL0683183.1 HAD family hydrolase [Aquimarina mytili]
MEPILSFRELQKEAKKVDTNAREIKVAVLGNHTTTFFSKALKNQLTVAGFETQIYESDYDQIDITIIDAQSGLYEFDPEVIVIFESALKLKDKFYALDDNQGRTQFYNDVNDSVKNRISLIRANNSKAKIIYFTYELLDDHLYGNLFSKIPHSFYKQLWKINNSILNLSEEEQGFYVFEINKYLQGTSGYRDWPAYINSDLHYSIDTFAVLTYHVTQFVKALKGNFKKCLILDLDNTTWGGIIGDDGIENIQVGSLGIGKAFSRLQKWAKELKERGIILAICSKNTEEVAKEPFEKHSEMILRLKDISVFVANWKNKADNIRYIQEVLNIGFDSMVFIDDNPAERDIVRQSLPEVTVPELPEDPALYLPYLTSLNLFETASYSDNDKDRTVQYQQEAERKKLISSVTNMDDYLKSLEMEGVIENFEEKDVSRIAQLTQRSNQFNLRTQRYTENDIKEFMTSENHLTYSVKLKDKFGDYGLISVIILEKKEDNSFFVDTWIMSCRVLKRGVEYYAMNKIVADVVDRGAEIIVGEYLETPKNKLVSDLLEKLSFESTGAKNIYQLNRTNYKPFNNYIS